MEEEETEIEESGPLTIGGREFLSMGEATIEHDLYLMSEARRAGLTQFELLAGEDLDAFCQRVLCQAIDAGNVFVLLGALIRPRGVAPEDWTPEIGAATADFLRRQMAPEDKATIRAQVVSLLLGFFESGLASVTTSPTSSTTSSPRAGEPESAARLPVEVQVERETTSADDGGTASGAQL